MVIDFLSSQRFSLMAPNEQTWKDGKMRDSSKKWYNSSSLIGYNYCSMPRNSDVNWIVNFFFVLRVCLWFNSLRISHSIPNQGWKNAYDFPMDFYTASENTSNPYLFRYRDFFSCRKCFCCFSNENKKKLHELAQIYISETEPLVYEKFYAHSSSGMLENESSTISIHTLFINCKELLNPDCCCFRWAALNFQPFRNVLLFSFFSVYYVRITFFHCRNTLCLEQKCDGFFSLGKKSVFLRWFEETRNKHQEHQPWNVSIFSVLGKMCKSIQTECKSHGMRIGNLCYSFICRSTS